MQTKTSNRNRPYVNQAKRSLYNVFKQSATITSQSNIAEQMQHLQFQKQSVRVKQIKALLDEYPEHFIVNEGKEAKKFFSDATKSHVSVPLPPIYCAWPSFALRLSEREQIGLNPLMQGILLASCRYNNQDASRSMFDTTVGIMHLEQEMFTMELVEVSMHALFSFYFLEYSTIVQSAAHNWLFFQYLCSTQESITADDTNPIMYLFDHVCPIEVSQTGPYTMDVNQETEYENIPLIVILHMQLVRLLVDAEVLPREKPSISDLTAAKLGKMASAVMKFLKTNQIESDQLKELVYEQPRGLLYMQTIVEFLPLAMYLNSGYLQPEMKDVGSFAATFVAALDLLQLRLVASHIGVDEIGEAYFATETMSRIEVLFQLQGLTQTPGFGLLHIPTNELLRSKVLGVSGVTPESREYLQLLASSHAAVASRPIYPSTTQMTLYNDVAVADVPHSYWELKSSKKRQNNDVAPYIPMAEQLFKLDTLSVKQTAVYKQTYLENWKVALTIPDLFKGASKSLQTSVDRILYQVQDRLELLLKGREVDLFDDEEAFLFLFKSAQKTDVYEQVVKANTAARLLAVQKSNQDGRDFSGFLSVRHQLCNYSVYDRLTLLRSTSDFMETDAKYFNGGYSKLSSSIALTVECSHSTYHDKVIDSSVSGSWTVMAQQSKVLAETFQRSQAAQYEQDVSYGDMLTSLLFNSKVSQLKQGVWQPNIGVLPDRLLDVRYFDSLACVNEQFCSQQPTMFVVRYDQNRLRDDQKISSPDDETQTQLVDRIIYMEPSASFVDSFRLHQRLNTCYEVILRVAKIIVKAQQDFNSDPSNVEKMSVDDEEFLHKELLNNIYSTFQTETFKGTCDSVERRFRFSYPQVANVAFPTYESAVTNLATFIEDTVKTVTSGMDGSDDVLMKDEERVSQLLKLCKRVLTSMGAATVAEIADSPQIKVQMYENSSKLQVISELYTNYEEYDTVLPSPSYMSISDRVSYFAFKNPQVTQEQFVSVQDYSQCNVTGTYIGTASREEFDFSTLRDAMALGLWQNWIGEAYVSDTEILEIASLARLMQSFRREGLSLTAQQVFEFLRTVANKDPNSQRRFMVRVELPKQRVAFADYIEQMSITTFTSGLMKQDFQFLFESSVVDSNATRTVKLKAQEYTEKTKDQSVHSDVVFYSPSYFPTNGLDSPVLGNVNFDFNVTATKIHVNTSYVKRKSYFVNQFSSRPAWSIKASTTYTRKSVTPGLQLLRLHRDLTDQIAINHPTVRVLEKKTMNSTYMFRDVLIHMSKLRPIEEKTINKLPDDGMFKDEDGAGQVMLPSFNTKTTQLYMNSYISERIMSLLGTANLSSPGMTSQFARHVGVPFFTPLTRLQILNNTARAFQIRFAEAGVFGGQPIVKKRHQTFVSETPVLGAIYTNLVPTHLDDTLAIKILRHTRNWTDLFGYFMSDCLPSSAELDLLRQYQSKYTLQGDKTWKGAFPLIVQAAGQPPVETQSFLEKAQHTGMLRARYLMQATHYELSKLFEKEYSGVSEQDMKSLLAVALVYKESLMKYLTSVKFTVGMYQDNPFLIESFAQVYFQGVRQRSVGDLVMVKHNSKIASLIPPNAVANSLFEYSSASDVEQTAVAHDVKFQHLLVSVFVEQMLARQGCPVDPFIVMKDFVMGRVPSFQTMIAQMYTATPINIVNQVTATKAAEMITKTTKPGERYLAAMKTYFVEQNLQTVFESCTPYQLSLWDQYQTKFVGDPQLLFEVFMETYHLADGNINTQYVLNKMVDFKQARYNLETKASARICPQFCTFRDPAQRIGFNARATLMDHIVDAVYRLFVVRPKHLITTHEDAKKTFYQLVKDMSELCQFVCNIFSLQLSAYSRGQTKGTKDSENYQLLRMIQMYAAELQQSIGLVTSKFEEGLKEKLFYSPFVRPEPDNANMADDNAEVKEPPAPVPVSEAEFQAHVKTLKEPNQVLIESDEVAFVQQITKHLKDNIRMIVAFTVYLPRVSQNDTMNEMNRSVVDVSTRYRSQVERDAPMRIDMAVEFVESAKVLGYYLSQKIVAVPTLLMQLVKNVLLSMATGLQFKETVFQTKDNVNISVLEIEPLLDVNPPPEDFKARHVTSAQYAEKLRDMNNPEEGKRNVAVQSFTPEQQRYVIWLHVQRRLTDFMKENATEQSAQNAVTQNHFKVVFTTVHKNIARTTWSTSYLEANTKRFPAQG